MNKNLVKYGYSIVSDEKEINEILEIASDIVEGKFGDREGALSVVEMKTLLKQIIFNDLALSLRMYKDRNIICALIAMLAITGVFITYKNIKNKRERV